MVSSMMTFPGLDNDTQHPVYLFWIVHCFENSLQDTFLPWIHPFYPYHHASTGGSVLFDVL